MILGALILPGGGREHQVVSKNTNQCKPSREVVAYLRMVKNVPIHGKWRINTAHFDAECEHRSQKFTMNDQQKMRAFLVG